MSPPRNGNNIPGEIDVVGIDDTPPLSRTHQYRKVMKPLLERKRRARINGYLDELKDLMVTALQAEGESITKLEKADVLQLTLNHLQKLKRQQMLQTNPAIDMDRYRAGYTACAGEVGRVMSSIPGVNISLGTQLMSYLGEQVTSFKQPLSSNSNLMPSCEPVNMLKHQSHSHHQRLSCTASTVSVPVLSIPKDSALEKNMCHSSAYSPLSDRGYNSDRDASPSPPGKSLSPVLNLNPIYYEEKKSEVVWRPF
jgi:hairy-and-enhancer-of-split protein